MISFLPLQRFTIESLDGIHLGGLLRHIYIRTIYCVVTTIIHQAAFSGAEAPSSHLWEVFAIHLFRSRASLAHSDEVSSLTDEVHTSISCSHSRFPSPELPMLKILPCSLLD